MGLRLTILDARSSWTIVRGRALAKGEVAVEPSRVVQRIARWCASPSTLSIMLALYEEVSGERLRPPTDDEIKRRVVPTLTSAFLHRRLVAVETSGSTWLRRTGERGIHGTVPKKEPPAPPPAAPKKAPQRISEKTFLDVTVVNGDGVPLAGRRYKLQLPNGATEQGTLGSDGRLLKTNIDPGTGRLTILPDKGEVVAAAEPEPEEDVSFVEIEMVDASGKPAAGVRYQVDFPNGLVRSGTLDQNGVAFLEGVPEGKCDVSFPDLDGEAWSLANDAEA